MIMTTGEDTTSTIETLQRISRVVPAEMRFLGLDVNAPGKATGDCHHDQPGLALSGRWCHGGLQGSARD